MIVTMHMGKIKANWFAMIWQASIVTAIIHYKSLPWTPLKSMAHGSTVGQMNAVRNTSLICLCSAYRGKQDFNDALQF
jgi:hypothetical protein